jgi:hypothetical protein
MREKVTGQVIELGDKLHIITRRLFHDDIRRHFAGEVTNRSSELYELQGYTFGFNSSSNQYSKRPELRTRIYSLGEAGYIVNKLPREIDIASLKYQVVEKRLVVTDLAGFSLDINEFGIAN